MQVHLNSLGDKTVTAFLDQPSVELSMNVLQEALHKTFYYIPLRADAHPANKKQQPKMSHSTKGSG